SEQGGIDFRTYENLTSLTAPFGTTNTPVIGTKIIGGVQVPVIEHLSSSQENGSFGIGITKLTDIADKPNNVNPDLLRRGARTYFSAQQVCMARQLATPISINLLNSMETASLRDHPNWRQTFSYPKLS
ncbi:uncharacterized protein LOC110440921, partial [Mizuhopecten yessoensis]|uniref:uncharacterized protein LOC110440921 n=1 Tax=Mizuhopecten yessoensis TaxID=6573 RepID=UPI000B45AF4B